MYRIPEADNLVIVLILKELKKAKAYMGIRMNIPMSVADIAVVRVPMRAAEATPTMQVAEVEATEAIRLHGTVTAIPMFPDPTGPRHGTLNGQVLLQIQAQVEEEADIHFHSSNQNAITVAPGNSAWGGDWRMQRGGLGGRPLDYSTGKIFLGGGGGAGSQNNSYGGDGGNGGGIVYILGYGTVTGAGTITSNGELGENSQGSAPLGWWAGVDGSGGGGAGGTIIINTESTVSGVSLTASGGNGGNQVKSYGAGAFPPNANTEAEGPGGGGGGGYIAISSGTPTRTANGGANGITNSTGLSEFTPNGATRGGTGTNNASITPTTLTVSNVNACIGDDITITATLGGSVPGGTQVVWWDAAVAGTSVHTGTTYTINNASNSDTLWVGFCPGWYRERVIITVSGPVCVASNDTTICSGNTAQLNASGGVSYAWSPGGSLSNPGVANPVATPATTTLYYVTATEGACESIDSVLVTVVPQMDATITSGTDYCSNDASVSFTAVNGGGSWSGNGISAGGIFDPVAAGAGIHEIVYTIAGMCGDTDTLDVTVFAAPIVNLGADTSICDGTTLQLDAGAGYTNYNWNPAGSNQTYDVTTSGTYIVTVTDANTCLGTDQITVTVVTQMDATITSGTDYCSNDASVSFTAVDGGGSWSGNGISAGGVFDPVAAGAGIHEIVYTIAGMCGDTDTLDVTVFAAPIVNLGADTTICDGTTLQLDAGAGYTNYNWNPAGSNQTYDVTTSGTYIVTVTDANTCLGTDQITVTVVTQMNATITSGTDYCSNDASVSFTAVNGGGTWSGNGITAGGVFDPVAAGAGIHEIVYTITGMCGDTDTLDVTVFAAPIVNLGADTTICDGTTLQLDAGAGYTNYNWNPAGSNQTYDVTTSGTYNVTVTDANTCLGTDQITVTVVTQMDATITSGTDYCSNDASVSFTAVDGGGTWSGNGISAGGVFDPVAAGAGVHEIIYTIPSACGDADTVNINVFAAPMVNLGADTTLCDGSSLVLDAGAGYSTYNWTPAGSNQTYTVNSSGTYQVTVIDGNNCGGSDEITISYLPQADASITTATAEYCSNDSPVNFTATDPGGVWSGNGITNPGNGTFDPSTAGAGTHSVIYTISGICGDADTVYVDVHAAPEPDLGSITQICEDSSYTLDAGSGYVSYNWSPSGNTQTMNVTTGGTYSVTVTDSNGCSGSTSITMTTEPWADATIIPSGPWCDNDAALTLTAAENGGVWSGNGVSSGGIFTPSLAGAGVHPIIYTISGPCGDTDTTEVIVNESPLLTLTVSPETCAGSNDAIIELIISGGSLPYDILWNNGWTTQLLENLMPGTYSVLVSDNNNCTKTAQETVIAATNDCFAAHVFLPNVFSPNGDGENDVLYVRGEGIQELELIIYNRWGEKVFETTNQEKGWDGTFKGIKAEAGVYSYFLRAEFSGNVTKKLNGTITLVY
jgi:gliding motility-associated-like protein